MARKTNGFSFKPKVPVLIDIVTLKIGKYVEN